jgi:hypothetical protein
MSTRKHTRELLAYAKAIGIRDVEVRHRGRHPAICGTAPSGRLVRVHFSWTPSDRYGPAAARRDLNRAVRA